MARRRVAFLAGAMRITALRRAPDQRCCPIDCSLVAANKVNNQPEPLALCAGTFLANANAQEMSLPVIGQARSDARDLV